MQTYSLKEITTKIGIKHIIGDENARITEPIQLDAQNEHTDVIMWASVKNYESLKQVKCGAIICQNIDDQDINPNCHYLIAENPRSAFRLLLQTYFMQEEERCIAQTAVIDPSVKLGKNVSIGEYVVIEAGCVIGDDTTIGHNTVIKRKTIIGNRVQIGSSNVIGGVGFGYEKDENGEYVLIPHVGNVVIENGVEIGNNTCVDRGVLGSTLLKENCKIDNLVHIAHGAVIGRNALVIALALVAGSVEVGDNAWVAPSSSIIQKVKIGKNATIGMGAVVLKNVGDDEVWVGNPAKKLFPKD
ncbi:MAG: UDP-3-O-(3-hydroxymyristoyl)glucosamine N-acyltransferase [Saprospiraceae bacterium]|nr:UDP-3-O-(3-hydroxymyristoyl)glucosamine N-acyltransferase [Saprospiraceae bacterium]